MTNQTRRDVLKKGLQVAAVGVGAGLIWDLFLQKSAKAQGFVPRPPGALPPDQFETACSKCGLCVEACPYDTLKLARSTISPPLEHRSLRRVIFPATCAETFPA